MKKLITLSLLLLTIFSVSAKDIWESTTYAEWQVALEKVTDTKTKTIYQTFDTAIKYCLETDLSKVTYKDFKDTILSKENPAERKGILLTLVARIKPAVRFFKDALADKEISTLLKRRLLDSKTDRFYLKNNEVEVSPETYREWCLDLIKTKQLANAKVAVNYYATYLADSLKPETVLADMKMAKRSLYFNITSNNWKPVLVKIELLIKANE